MRGKGNNHLSSLPVLGPVGVKRNVLHGLADDGFGRRGIVGNVAHHCGGCDRVLLDLQTQERRIGGLDLGRVHPSSLVLPSTSHSP